MEKDCYQYQPTPSRPGRKRRIRRRSQLLQPTKKAKLDISYNKISYDAPKTPVFFIDSDGPTIKKPGKKVRKKPDARRNLFTDETRQYIEEIVELLPPLLKILKNAGMLFDFLSLLRLLSSGKLSPVNLPFMLCLEKARYLSLNTTSQMWYWPETLKWWKIVYRLLNGKALRLMSGPKNAGQLLKGTTERGCYDPVESVTNFVVPDISLIRNHNETELPSTIQPGILQGAVQIAKKTTEKYFVLSMDGKKVAAGLKGNVGDIDMWGHESPSLQETNVRLEREIALVDASIQSLHRKDSATLLSELKSIVTVLTNRIKDVREMMVKQNLALTRFEQLSLNSKESEQKYVFAISSTRAILHQAKSFISHSLQVIGSLCYHGSAINNSANFSLGPEINTMSQANIVCLKDPQDLPDNLANNPQFIKQRTAKWQDLRGQVHITGSTLYRGLGLSSLKEQKQHVQTKVLGQNDPVLPDDVQARMRQGVEDEDKAVATLAAVVLPFLFGPRFCYVEEGAKVINGSNGTPLLVSSSDGSLRECFANGKILEEKFVVEIKRPQETPYKPPVHYHPPHYYICQLLAEMAAHNTSEALYLSYSTDSMTVCRVEYDDDLWSDVFSEADRLYGREEKAKVPTKISPESKLIKAKLQNFIETKTSLLAEVPSLKNKDFGEREDKYPSSPYLFSDALTSTQRLLDETQLSSTLDETKVLLKECHMLSRRKATEILAFVLSDTDRLWNPEFPHHLPIAYAMKGYSLPIPVARNMVDDVLQKLAREGIKVACLAVDGQFYQLVSRGLKDQPLTVHQLRRDVWRESEKMSKSVIIANIKAQMSENCLIVQEEKLDNSHHFVVYSASNKLSRLSTPTCQKLWRTAELIVRNPTTNQQISVDCLPDDAANILLENDPQEDVTQDAVEIENSAVSVDVETTADASFSHTEMCTCSLSEEEINLLKEKLTISNDRWNELTIRTLQDYLSSAKNLSTKFLNSEINLILDCLDTARGPEVKKTWPKWKKVNMLSKIFGDGSEVQKTTVIRNPPSLKKLANRIISSKKYPKAVLNVVWSNFIFPEKLSVWQENGSTTGMKLENFDTPMPWYSTIEYNDDRHILEPKCVDPSHLLTNLRVKVTKDGVDGVPREAFRRVSDKTPGVLSRAIVYDFIDRQNVAFALRVFSSEVEEQMKINEDLSAADFVHHVREWYRAIDEPGIPSIQRMSKLVAMRQYLLQDVRFDIFPPPGSHIKGFPVIWFDSMLQNIDTRLQLYGLIGPYCQRSVGTLAAESFFGDLSEMDQTKLGCPKSIHIPRLMASVTEMNHYRHDPDNRCFSITTSKKNVYPFRALDESSAVVGQRTCGLKQRTVTHAVISNHNFDQVSRKRTKPRRKAGDVKKPEEPSRGVRPVRYHHRCDESKILPTTRLGI